MTSPRPVPGRWAILGEPGAATEGLGDHDPPRRADFGQTGETGEYQGYEGRLAGTGRRAEHRRPVLVERPFQGGHSGAYGQPVEGFGTDHEARSSRSQTKIAVPGIRAPRSGDQPPHSWSFHAGHSGSTRSTSRKPPATTSRTRSPSVL